MHRSIWIEWPATCRCIQYVDGLGRLAGNFLPPPTTTRRAGREYGRRWGTCSEVAPILVTQMNAWTAVARSYSRYIRRRRRCRFFGNHWSTQWTAWYHSRRLVVVTFVANFPLHEIIKFAAVLNICLVWCPREGSHDITHDIRHILLRLSVMGQYFTTVHFDMNFWPTSNCNVYWWELVCCLTSLSLVKI